jgi:hypothetical protein
MQNEQAAAFAERFDGVEPVGGWQINILYKRHPLFGNFLPASMYETTINNAVIHEAIILLRDVGASAIIIDNDLYEKLSGAESFTATANVPNATPVQQAEASIQSEWSTAHLSSNRRHVTFENAIERAKHPRISEDSWYIYHDYMRENRVEKLVLDRLTNKAEAYEDCIEFKVDDRASNATNLSLHVDKILGVATRNQKATNYSSFYKFKVVFAGAEEKAIARKTLGSMEEEAVKVRASMSRLANVRSSFRTERTEVREDVKLAVETGQYVGVDEWKENALTYVDWLRRTPSDVTLTIPFVFYGPKGNGKTSLINTWDAFLNYTPLRFLKEGARMWLRDERGCGHEHSTVIRNVKFDPSRTVNRALRTIPEEEEAAFVETNAVRLLFHDTATAQDATTDVKGKDFPFGVQVLVLDARDVLAAAEAKQQGTPDTQYETFIDGFLGANRIQSQERHKPGLKRYPPMCVMLTMTNELDDEACELAKDYFKETFSVEHVFATPTLVPPTDEERIAFLRSAKAHKAYLKRWDNIGAKSLTSLVKMSDATALVEHENWVHLTQNPGRRPVSIREQLGGYLRAMLGTNP